jgi:hypothetical protein
VRLVWGVHALVHQPCFRQPRLHDRRQAVFGGLGQQITDLIIKNTYRTLMTRGMKGCYIYSTDPETVEYFKNRLI